MARRDNTPICICITCVSHNPDANLRRCICQMAFVCGRNGAWIIHLFQVFEESTPFLSRNHEMESLAVLYFRIRNLSVAVFSMVCHVFQIYH